MTKQNDLEKLINSSLKTKSKFSLLIKNTESKEILRLAKEKLKEERAPIYTPEEIKIFQSQINKKLMN